MSTTTAAKTFAAVWSPPNHPITWTETLSVAIAAIGALIALSGMLTTLTILRSAKPPAHKHVRPAFTVGGAVAAMGAMIVALGVWLYR